jgi:hypothetical protein
MMTLKRFSYLFVIVSFVLLASCEKDDTKDSDVLTEFPVIDSLTTSMVVMEFGSTIPAVLSCSATGGNLEYLWEVDLGELFVMNTSGSEAQYSASPCCIGEKVITCTVSNDKGSASESIFLMITE